MKYTSLACATALIGLFSSTAMASGPIEIRNGDLVVNLGDAPGNGSRRTLRLGNYGNEVNYAFTDENGVNTIGTISGFNGENVEILSGIGRDSIELLGLETDNLFIDTGRGRDTVYMNFVNVNNALDIDTRGGQDTVMFINVIVDGITTLRTRGGRDNVSIASTQFEGLTRIITGATAADELSVSFSRFSGPVAQFSGGGGGDDIFNDDGTNFFQLEPRIRNFEIVERAVDLDPVDPVDPVDPDPVLFAVGDTGPGGGIVFEVNDAGDAGLEVFPTVVGEGPLAYGCVDVNLVDIEAFNVDNDLGRQGIPGDTMRTLFDAAGCISPAAEATFAFSTPLADDWYLPSADELVTLLTALTPVQFPRAPEHWSASEDTAQNAFIVFELQDGFDISPNAKTTVSNVLAVRSFGTNAN